MKTTLIHLTAFLLVIIAIHELSAQKEDNIWVMGYTSYSKDDPDLDSFMGSIFFDFNDIPVKIYRVEDNYTSFQETMTSMCDQSGRLVFFSNGMFIYNADFEIMDNGDSIAYGKFWERFADNTFLPPTYYGLRIWQGALSLPFPGNEGKYVMIYEDYDINHKVIKNVYFAIIDIKENNGLGKVIHRDIDLLPLDSINGVASWGMLTACKHANGRDWWILFPHTRKNLFYTYLLDPNGLKLIKKQEIVNKIDLDLLGQTMFSPDGSKFAMFAGRYLSNPGWVRIYDFDRCTGELTNEISDTLLSSFAHGLCFSPSGRYLYCSNDISIIQYDLESQDVLKSRKDVAIWDKWKNEWGRSFTLGWMALGQDKKIYVIPNAGNSSHIHRIDKPDIEGEACTVQQHIIKMPTRVGTSATIPNYPNFRLGPLDGSECDTLGIDNHPVSRFSYEQDTLNFLNISFTDLSYFEPKNHTWHFGDGSYSYAKNPVHLYSTKGSYTVCLSVENENSSDTSCRILNLGIVSNNVTDNIIVEVHIYPNPMEDVLLVTFSDYAPENAVIEFYDLLGNKIFASKLYYGMNSVNVRILNPGYLLYRIVENNIVIQTGKLIKLK